MSNLDINSSLVKKDGIESKKSKLFKRKEAIYDYHTAMWTGHSIEILTLLTNMKVKSRNLRWFCCLRLYQFIKALQEDKNFSSDELIEVFEKSDLDIKKVKKILKEVKDKQDQFEAEENE